MAQPIEHIIIVGGGTAGWLAANLLNSRFGERENAPKITLIESPDIPTVGVGEATVPNMPRTLRDIGIDQKDFLRRCNASFKLGVLFGRWNVDNDGNLFDYMNPFGGSKDIEGYGSGEYYM